MKDFASRAVVSATALAAVGLLTAFSSNLMVQGLTVLAIAGLVGIGVWEYAGLARLKGLSLARGVMIAIAVAQVISLYLGLHGWVSKMLSPVVLGLGAVFFFTLRFRDTQNALVQVAAEVFGVIYLAVPLGMMLGILYPEGLVGQDGRIWLLYLVLVTKSADVAGYFIGGLWGKRSLAPALSPNKTVEGAVAGFIASTVVSIGFSWVGLHWVGGFVLPLSVAVVLGALIGVLGQLGDLAESVLKRDASVKDSNTLPGIGGVLDLVDSLLFSTPVVYFYLHGWSM